MLELNKYTGNENPKLNAHYETDTTLSDTDMLINPGLSHQNASSIKLHDLIEHKQTFVNKLSNQTGGKGTILEFQEIPTVPSIRGPINELTKGMVLLNAKQIQNANASTTGDVDNSLSNRMNGGGYKKKKTKRKIQSKSKSKTKKKSNNKSKCKCKRKSKSKSKSKHTFKKHYKTK
jgi:hypothetical protein